MIRERGSQTGDVVVNVKSVARKGRVTIPSQFRQQLGIRQGSRVAFALVGNHIEMRVESASECERSSGFGMLRSARKAVPVDFDITTLAKRTARR